MKSHPYTHVPFRFLQLGVFALLAGTLAACSSSKATTDSSTPDARTEDSSTSELEALYWAQKDSARTLFTSADVEFMTGMISHHAQALVMSRKAPSHGASERVQTLASRIINAQTDEIKTMQNWLRDRGQTVPEVHIDGTMMMVHGGGDHAMHMPGMLTPGQMKELDESRGREFDRLFLTYMIQHHSGALTMVSDLFAQDGAALDELSFKLASDINVDQITEIKRMKLMLESIQNGSH